MLRRLVHLLPEGVKARREAALLTSALVLLNAGGWAWALVLFHDRPAQLGVAFLVFGLGLRHGCDADHIAAIDTVTRKLMHQGQRPLATGFWFAIGHASIVVLVTLVVVSATRKLENFEGLRETGGTVSLGISAMFLLAVAAMNFVILKATIGAMRRLRAGERIDDGALDLLFSGRGLLARLFRPLFRAIGRPWHMAPLGFLFGLSFDTATEVALFSLSATQVAEGVPLYAGLVFPFLFAAGMALVDTADGVLMVGAYRWALIDPLRKLHYNMTITLMAIAVALFIGGVELLVLATRLLWLDGPLASLARGINDSFGLLGFGIIGAFAIAWLVSNVLFRRIGALLAAAT